MPLAVFCIRLVIFNVVNLVLTESKIVQNERLAQSGAVCLGR